MNPAGPPILAYEPPARDVPPFARRSEATVVLVGVVVPGLSSWLIRGRRGAITCLGLCGGVGASFLFFGPFWGEVLFRGTRYKESGLWPFLATCVAVPIVGGVLGARDRRRALRSEGRA